MSIDNKDAVETVKQAVEWLQENPILVGAFFGLGILNVLGDVSGFFNLIGTIAAIYLNSIAQLFAREELAGNTPAFEEASSQVIDRFLPIAAVSIATALIVGIGLVLLILPGIYLALRLSLALPACVLGEEDIVDSLKTSWGLTSGILTKIFKLGVMTVGVMLVGSFLIGMLFGSPGFGIGGLLTAALTAVVVPVLQMSLARIYLEAVDGESTPDSPEPTEAGAVDEAPVAN